ncbi:MAG: OmpA family protein [Chitinispirillaceae bacterium]|nr:OmpA family protein [Chitinispirillaceae bacterium]
MLLGALVAVYLFAQKNPDKEIVLFGHSDTSGDPAYNYDLSEWRAEGMKALLDGDADIWLDVIDLASKVEDYQTILKTLSAAHGWACDPGEVDNISGSKTKTAIKSFQTKYKEEFNAPQDFKVDGEIGPQTWKALFEVVHSLIVDVVKEEIGEEPPVLSYGNGGRGFYPCGESFPIDSIGKDNYKSAENRRVEIVFYDRAKPPKLKEPADKTAVTKDEAIIYNSKKADLKVIETDAMTSEKENKKKTVLEIEDVLFNLNSAVMLPDIPESTTSDQGFKGDENGVAFYSTQGKTTGLSVLRAIYRFIEQFPDKKIVIAGHTDTSGEVKNNFDLSALRANNVLHLLTGDGDAWADISYQQHKVEDYQQILKHYAQLLLWPCDPGKVDNKIGPKTRRAVTSFQSVYNSFREQMNFSGPELTVKEPDGETLNRETWRAFFDLYIWETAIIVTGSHEPDALQEFIDKMTFVDDENRVIACGESFPIDEEAKDNYRSQKNRRVEVLFFDEGEAPDSLQCPEPGDTVYTTDDVPLYDKEQYTDDYIKVHAPEFIPFIDIQSVDSMGCPVPNSSMLILSDNTDIEEEFSKEIQTDNDSFVRVFGVPVGTISIADSEGNSLSRLANNQSEPATFAARKAMPGITSIIVKEASKETIENYAHQRKIYSTVPADGALQTAPGSREEKVKEFINTDSRFAILAVDNLLLAAGLTKNDTVNMKGLVSDTLKKYLYDFHPSVKKKDFIVFHLFYSDSNYKVGVYTSDGTLLKEFNLVYNFQALVGAYSVFESTQSSLFVDLAYQRHIIKIVGEDQSLNLDQLVAENEQEEFTRLILGHISKAQITYFCRSPAHLVAVGLAGGTGYLEPYRGTSTEINDRIHTRNMAVVKMHSDIYEAYITNYIAKADNCETEEQLRKLGPPMSGYHYPSPVNATDSQLFDLVKQNTTGGSEYKAWVAISKRINYYIGRRATGFYFLAKYSYSQKLGKYTKVQFEYNFTYDADGKKLEKLDKKLVTTFETDINAKAVKKLTKKTVNVGLEHELDLETGENKVKGTLKVGKYGFELTNDGSAKCTNGPFSTEVNPQEKTFGAGVELEAGENQKVYFGMGFQGVREDTVLAFVSQAPGFFERRPHSELLAKTTKWNDLSIKERSRLEDLGFDMQFWDDKHNRSISEFPSAATKSYFDLNATEQVAIVHLGFNATTWPGLIKATAKQ